MGILRHKQTLSGPHGNAMLRLLLHGGRGNHGHGDERHFPLLLLRLLRCALSTPGSVGKIRRGCLLLPGLVSALLRFGLVDLLVGYDGQRSASADRLSLPLSEGLGLLRRPSRTLTHVLRLHRGYRRGHTPGAEEEGRYGRGHDDDGPYHGGYAHGRDAGLS